MLIEYIHGNLDQRRVSYPGTVVSSRHFSFLVCSYFGHSGVVLGGVILDRDLCRHTTHRCHFTPGELANGRADGFG